jgi:hypothetical protein
MIRSVRKYLHQNFAGHTALLSLLLFVGIMTVSLRGTDIGSLVASATSSLIKAPAVLYFTPYDDEIVQVGDTRVPINAIGITVKFPRDTIEVLGFSKEKSFLDLWTEETSIKEEIGEVHFSGGTFVPDGFLGTSTALTLTVRAKKSGEARLTFENTEVFASDGKGENIPNDSHSFTFTVLDTPRDTSHGVAGPSGSASGNTTPEQPLPRSADLNGDGSVTLIDVSILAIRIFGPYDPRFDLDMDGAIGLSDLSILLSKMGG